MELPVQQTSDCGAARTPTGQFAPGHSGNPAGRPRGSKGVATLLVAALRAGEDEAIHRVVIEAALAGDKTAARFCASRMDSAARHQLDPAQLDITPAEARDSFLLHTKLVEAVVEGRMPAKAALETIRLVAAKRQLDRYGFGPPPNPYAGRERDAEREREIEEYMNGLRELMAKEEQQMAEPDTDAAVPSSSPPGTSLCP